MINRNDKREAARQLRCVLGQEAALFQRVQNQGDVALGEVADATVHELGAAAGRALGEVHLLHEESGIAARSGFNGRAQPRGAAADDEHVPDFAVLGEAL